MCRTCASVLILTVLAPGSLGQATYVSQDRWIEAADCAIPVTKFATNFEPFNESLSFTLSWAKQNSTLGPWLIHGNGSGGGSKQNGCCGYGESFCATTIVIGKPTAWSLNGKLSVSCTGEASWTLDGPATKLVFAKNYPETGIVPLSGSGVLEPGTYSLTVSIGSGCMGGINGGCSGSATFDFDFAMTYVCDPDCDSSGSLDIDDFLCFQTLYAIGC